MTTNCISTFNWVDLRHSRNDDNSNKHCDGVTTKQACVITSVRMNSVGKVRGVRHKSGDRVGANEKSYWRCMKPVAGCNMNRYSKEESINFKSRWMGNTFPYRI